MIWPAFRLGRQPLDRHRPATVARWASLMIAIPVIFVADTLTNYEIAVAVFYVGAILIAAGFLPARGVLAVSVISSCLTLVSFFLTQGGAYEAGVVNCILSICAIAVTTYLALERSTALLAEHAARAQLAHLARVNALGEMAASIAHEVNQPLTGIVASGAACRNWLAGEPPNIAKAQQAIERMIMDANRASEIISHVRNLSKRAEPERAWIDAEALVSDVLTLCRSELDLAGVAVVRKSGSGLLLVFADGVQIQQVLLNLVLNALEAMNGVDSRTRELTIETMLLPGNVAEFAVTDTGKGIDPARVEQIFDPFYSTKADGVGMGLAISRSIVETHGGRIWACPHPRDGAEFHFTLPARALGAV
ncbi:sensor histidine kinase [Sphingomonas sp. ERG5]|uniref:sensor histidine kinase n=1 Tax=Sphingomonas sp. ERG5 TaxID=1381597 RepID=UPI0009DF8D7E|nr:sensor histidine kinase [Sphingomonas sp. ERG5]